MPGAGIVSSTAAAAAVIHMVVKRFIGLAPPEQLVSSNSRHEGEQGGCHAEEAQPFGWKLYRLSASVPVFHWRITSITIGSTDTAMIPMTTSSKFFFTTSMLPNM